MKKQKGFTLIEGMIVVAILGIIGALLVPVFNGNTGKKDTVNTGMTEIKHHQKSNSNTSDCFRGYVMLPNGNQMVDASGHGVPCN